MNIKQELMKVAQDVLDKHSKKEILNLLSKFISKEKINFEITISYDAEFKNNELNVSDYHIGSCEIEWDIYLKTFVDYLNKQLKSNYTLDEIKKIIENSSIKINAKFNYDFFDISCDDHTFRMRHLEGDNTIALKNVNSTLKVDSNNDLYFIVDENELEKTYDKNYNKQDHLSDVTDMIKTLKEYKNIIKGLESKTANITAVEAKKIEVGDKCEILLRKKWQKATITHIVPKLSRYEVGFLVECSGTVAWWKPKMMRGFPSYDNTIIRFLKKGTKKNLDDAKQERNKKVIEHNDKKYNEADKAYEKLKELNVEIGDEVLYKYSNATRYEIIGDINYKTGKIGIVTHKGPAKDDYLEALMWKKLLNKRGPREFRWLPADGIVKITKKHDEQVENEKKYPQKISPKDIAEMNQIGWKQITYGSEIIEASYVIATTPKNARNGNNYEGAENKVYLDIEQGFYWRKTGSFD